MLQVRPKVLFPPLLCNQGAQLLPANNSTSKRSTQSPTRSPLKSPKRDSRSVSPLRSSSMRNKTMTRARMGSGGFDGEDCQRAADPESFLDWVSVTFEGMALEEAVESEKHAKHYKCASRSRIRSLAGYQCEPA